MAAGRIYDSEENQRLKDLLVEQDKLFVAQDKEQKPANDNILRYTIIGAAAIIFLILGKIALNKFKK